MCQRLVILGSGLLSYRVVHPLSDLPAIHYRSLRVLSNRRLVILGPGLLSYRVVHPLSDLPAIHYRSLRVLSNR
ncbi:hypothetical protein J6590_001651, partial [Homalodisca vitripennis]